MTFGIPLRRRASRRSDKGLAYLILMRMGQANSAAHLQPLADAVAPAVLHVVRPGPRPENLMADNIRYWEVMRKHRVSQVLGTLLRALRVAAKHDIRMVMSFNAYPYGVMASLVGWMGGAPSHVGFIGSDLKALRTRPVWWRLVTRSALCTTPGPSSSVLLRQMGYRGFISELPHGVDVMRFNVGGPRDITCLFVGALIKRKRVDCVIEAMAQLKASHPDANLVIVGEGPLRHELEALAQDLGVSDSTAFAGRDERPETWMKRAEILIMPSEWEGLPYAMIEAMRCGVVPVVSPVGSIEDLVSDGDNGRVLVDRNPETIAEATSELLDDERMLRRMSQRAVQSTEGYTFENVSQVWQSTLEALTRRQT